MAMAKEYFWGITLSEDNETFKWDPEAEYADEDGEEDEEDEISHFLFLKQAVLGLKAKDDERNVVEIETVNFDGETVTLPIFSLRSGLNECITLDIGLQPPVTFKLASGTGPVCLSGQHAMDLQDDDYGKDKEGYELEDEDLEDEELEEETVRQRLIKGKEKKKAVIKDVKVPKKGKGDELDDDDEEDEDEEEEEEEEEEKQTAKGKKRPAPSTKGPAKKMSKPAYEDEEEDDDDDDDEEDDDDEDGIDWKMALGDDDDEDDDEEDEEEEDEDEEEEEPSPEKPAKKGKGKVNGTVKPKGTAKSQPNKTKDKDRKSFTVDDMKQDLIKSPSKPKKEEKFKNFVKSRFHLTEAKKIQELWAWYKSTQLK